MRVMQAFEFCSGHFLPLVPEGHKCKNQHGHNYRVEIVCEGIVTENGFVVDFFEIERWFRPILERLDHHNLNDVPGLENPTAEIICMWIYKELKQEINILKSVRIYETNFCYAEYEEE